jgi:hypothetical protein
MFSENLYIFKFSEYVYVCFGVKIIIDSEYFNACFLNSSNPLEREFWFSKFFFNKNKGDLILVLVNVKTHYSCSLCCNNNGKIYTP